MFAHLNPKERMAYAALGCVFLGFAGYVGSKNLKRSDPIVIQELSPHRTPNAALTAPANGPVVIHVAGGVKNPGVYKLDGDARVIDAVRAAGGFLAGVDSNQLNLAAKLQDGTQVFVPRKGLSGSADLAYAGGNVTAGPYGNTPPAPASHGSGKHPSGVVSLNSATADQLQQIPGIGPSTADRILDYRKEHGGFKSVDELTAVGGIGPKKLAAIRKWVKP